MSPDRNRSSTQRLQARRVGFRWPQVCAVVACAWSCHASTGGPDGGVEAADDASDEAWDDASDDAGILPCTAEAPSMPRPVAPANGAPTGSLWASDSRLTLRPLFTWQWEPDDCGDPHYEIEVDDSCDRTAFSICTFPSPEAAQAGVPEREWRPVANLPVSAVPPVGRRYYWRVRACRESSCSAWSPVRYVDVGRPGKDVNCDGYDDIVVCAAGAFVDGERRGRALVYFGGPGGIDTVPGTILDHPDDDIDTIFPAFGAFVGDIDGNGCADLALASSERDFYLSESDGAVFMYYGAAGGVSAMPDVHLRNPRPQAYAHFGTGLGGGDLNGDGFDDLAVGVPGQAVHRLDAGVVALYHGGPAGVARLPDQILEPPVEAAGWFGAAVAFGDLNSDGLADLAVGSPIHNGVEYAEGALLVYHGSPTGLGPAPSTRMESPVTAANVEFGYDVAHVGDFDADGYGDLIVGTEDHISPMGFEGRAFLYLGGPSGIVPGSGVVLDDPMALPFCGFGSRLAAIGDANGDGHADFLVAAPRRRPEAGVGATVHLFNGGPRGSGLGSSVMLTGHAGFGDAIIGRADFNGDGHPDVAIGGSPGVEAVMIYYGTADGIPVEPSFLLASPFDVRAGFGGLAR